MSQPTLTQATIDNIASQLQLQGYVLVADFLPPNLATALYQDAKTLSTEAFTPAGIGRDEQMQLDQQVRSDSTLWLNEQSICQKAYIDCMDTLRTSLNRRLFMGLDDFECHYSHYKKGQFYKKHLDAFQRKSADTRSQRVLSTVYYLNPNWQSADAGELLLYAGDKPQAILTVPPIFNTCILFLSDSFPHQVLASETDRYSIAGWYRAKG